MTAYYNEIDPFAAQWLRNLIAAGHIAPGDVDERSIEDVRPDDLIHYTQCHFFAGIGGWSYALRLAGWPDDRPVWTGSCPCQPFSAAGKGAGFADERHLWPALYHLIGERRPDVVFGEQVASNDGLLWLDLVHADLEEAGYAFGAFDLCAAGVGAPHIRQRLYWVAYNNGGAGGQGRALLRGRDHRGDAIEGAGLGRHDVTGRLDDSVGARLEGHGRHGDGAAGRTFPAGSVAPASEPGGMGHAERLGAGRDAGTGPEAQGGPELRPVRHDAGSSGAAGVVGGSGRCGPTDGLWRAADWLFCRDGKWRPVEPGTFPLAHGVPEYLGRVRPGGVGEPEKITNIEDLRRVWEDLISTEGRIPEEVLLSGVPVAAPNKNPSNERGRALPSAEYLRQQILRGLRGGRGEPPTSHRREPDEQRLEQYQDTLPEVPYGGAPLEEVLVGKQPRTGKLRGYGNAIVPQVAATFVGAYLDRHLRVIEMSGLTTDTNQQKDIFS